MKKFFTRYLLCALLCSGLRAGAQDSSSRHWALPDHAKLQFAGGIGFFSAGLGYELRKNRLESDLFYGYLPESVGGVTIHTLTAKLQWHATRPIDRGRIRLKPLTLGLLVSYTPGEQYFAFNPEFYPYNYYRYPTALHAGALLGGSIGTRPRPGKGNRQLGLYYELTTWDAELVSYATNSRALSARDILNLGIGLRASF